MITIDQIISECQVELDDEEGNRVQRGEYLSLANTIAREIARKTEIWIARYIATPNPTATSWSNTMHYVIGDVVTYLSSYYICILDHDATTILPTNVTYWTLINAYDISASYVIGDYVYYGSNPDFYRAIAADSGNLPTDSDFWLYIGNTGTYINTATIPYQSNNVVFDPFRILRVMRQYSNAADITGAELGSWFETTEYSPQAILASVSGIDSFRINETQLDARAFSTQFMNRTLSAINGITLKFATGFSIGDKVCIDYISGTPFTVTQWLNPVAQSIPEFLERPMKFGMLWEIFRKLYNKGDNNAQNKAIMNQQLYDKYLREAQGYSLMLRNKESSLQIQPINFLSE